MFKNIDKLPDDPILQLSQLYKQDTRQQKIDVGVGIFQNSSGNTPVMRAVKSAESRLIESQITKKYQPLSGNPEFNKNISKLVLGDAFDPARIRTNQSAGGTGALRAIAEVIAHLQPKGRLWIPDPTWGNHIAVFSAAGLQIKKYPYLDNSTCEVDRKKVFTTLESLGPTDSVLLHACCHNPSGADFTQQDWQKIVDIANDKGFTPIIDAAYLGMGENFEKDAYGLRLIAKNVSQALFAISCSKNFGLYRERTGAVLSLGRNTEEVEAMQTQVNTQTRQLISMAPDHGASVVSIILNDLALKADWQKELEEMAVFIRQRREKLQQAFADDNSRDWSFITRHRGMFTLLPLGKENVSKLREDFGIYIVGTGRINLAGLRNDQMIEYFAQSVKEVLS